MNLNQRQSEYDLNGSMTDEVIRIYGIPIKLLLAERINKNLTFGDHSHIKVDNSNIFLIYGLPENSEEFDQFERLQTQFGIPMETTMNIFVSKITLNNLIIPSDNSKNEIDITQSNFIHKLLSSLLVLPSGKIMEITRIDLDCPGLNNMFAFNKEKNIYRLFCKSYVHDMANEIDLDHSITAEPVENPIGTSFESLEKYFDELLDIKEKQNEEVEEYLEYKDNVFGRF